MNKMDYDEYDAVMQAIEILRQHEWDIPSISRAIGISGVKLAKLIKEMQDEM